MGEGSDTGVGVAGGTAAARCSARSTRRPARSSWEMELPAGVSNAPMTYMVNGKQYIVVAVSGRQYPGELVALAIP